METHADVHITDASTNKVEDIQDEISSELTRRKSDVDVENAQRTELVNGRYVKWATLSRHANTKAVKPWILKVEEPHDQYVVDGEWLDKQKIGGAYHMAVDELSAGDIIKVSGGSHNKKKHQYCRVGAITEDALYYRTRLKEADVIEEVG